MPQFDFFSFSGQNFWVLLTFFILYFFIEYFYIVNFSEIFKIRQKLITLYTSKLEKSFSLNLYDFFISMRLS